jgi:predicted aspartyl protease
MGTLSAALALGIASLASTAAGYAVAGDLPVRADVTQPGLSSQTPSSTDSITLARDRFDRMTMPITIAGHGTFDFLIDTGAQRSVLSSGLATRLGFAAGTPLRVTGLAGSEMVNTVLVTGMQLGKRTVDTITVPVFPDTTMETQGIVGIDGLKDRRILLDFRGKRMAIEDSAKPQPNDGYEIVVSARRRGGQLVMSHAVIDGIDTDIIIDTGADAAVGNRALQKALAAHPGSAVTLSSVTGQTIAAELGVATHLRIGRIQMSQVEIAFVDSPAFDALKLTKRPALLLGMHELRGFGRVAIDFPQRKILFDVDS